MTNDALDHLLTKLGTGDLAAAEQVFLAYEPILRRAVRRQLPPRLRAKFDSVDIVQSVWVSVLDGFRDGDWQFADSSRLRAFLLRAARNRFIDRVRQHRRAVERERPLVVEQVEQQPPTPQPRPSQVAEAEDLWQQMLARCPPEHRDILLLKRENYSLAEIAARTGLHADSVRRILRTLARQMAFGSQEENEK